VDVLRGEELDSGDVSIEEKLVDVSELEGL
jgi:hypothetical protein